MNIENIAEIEKILKFGIVLGGVDSLFAPVINVLMESSPWPVSLKREYCAKGGLVDKTKERAANIINEINNNYFEVPTVEKYKDYIFERIETMEKLARPYRN
jgi:hypothetical protein